MTLAWMCTLSPLIAVFLFHSILAWSFCCLHLWIAYHECFYPLDRVIPKCFCPSVSGLSPPFEMTRTRPGLVWRWRQCADSSFRGFHRGCLWASILVFELCFCYRHSSCLHRSVVTHSGIWNCPLALVSWTSFQWWPPQSGLESCHPSWFDQWLEPYTLVSDY